MIDIESLKQLLTQVKIYPVKNKFGQIKYYKVKFNKVAVITLSQSVKVKRVMELTKAGMNQIAISKVMKISQGTVCKYLKKGKLNENVMEGEKKLSL